MLVRAYGLPVANHDEVFYLDCKLATQTAGVIDANPGVYHIETESPALPYEPPKIHLSDIFWPMRNFWYKLFGI